MIACVYQTKCMSGSRTTITSTSESVISTILSVDLLLRCGLCWKISISSCQASLKCFNWNPYFSASLPGMWDRTITIGSAGKTFSVTGWKVGYTILLLNCNVGCNWLFADRMVTWSSAFNKALTNCVAELRLCITYRCTGINEAHLLIKINLFSLSRLNCWNFVDRRNF